MKGIKMSLVTLNGGFAQSRGEVISKEENDLITEFMRTKGVTQCPPVSASGNEVSRDTHDRIIEARKQFRANQRAKKAKK